MNPFFQVMFDPVEMIFINKYMLWDETVLDVLPAVGLIC